jgi:hypothetical protein
MKAIKYIMCLTLISASLIFAVKNVLGPTSEGLLFVANDPGMGLEEYTVTNDLGIKTWVILTGGGPKSKVTLDGKDGASPVDANILINEAKMIKGKKAFGTVDNLIFGVFSPVGQFNPQHLGIMTNYSPGTGITIKLKGVTVGTVIAGDNKLVQVDAVKNFATDSGFKAKGAKVMSFAGNVGGPSEVDKGWLGVPPEMQPIAALADYSEGCQIKMVKAKGAIDSLDVYASGIEKKGSPKSKMQAKPGGGTVNLITQTGWRTDKFKGVNVTTP